jgi:hypothetical protein
MLFRKYIFYFLFSPVFFFSRCTENNSSTTINGRIEKHAAGQVYFYSYPDSSALYADQMIIMDSCAVDGNGDYSLAVHPGFSHVFNLEYERKNLVSNFFISSGDKITIDFRGVSFIPEITSKGKASSYNNYLLDFQKAFYTDSAVKQQYYIVSNYFDLQQYARFNDERKHKQLELYRNYFKEDAVDSAFSNYALNSIKYGIAVDRLMYLWKKRMKNEHIDFDPAFLNFETKYFLENKNALIVPAYIRFLNLYVKDLYERKVQDGVYAGQNQNPFEEKGNLAETYLSLPFREVVLYNLALDDMKSVSSENRNSHSVSLDKLVPAFIQKYHLDQSH